MCCNKLEPAENFLLPNQVLKFVKSKDSIKPAGITYCPVFLLFPSETKKILAILINWNTKNTLRRSIIVKNLLSVGMDVAHGG